VLPVDRFPGVDARLGPEMRSTGEVMGIDRDFGAAFAKSQAGTGSMVLPGAGSVFVSVANRDKRAIVFPVMRLIDLGFDILATEGTADVLRRAGVPARVVGKVSQGAHEVLDLLERREIGLVLNTPFGSGTRTDGYELRQAAVTNGVPYITTLAGILAAIHGVEALRSGPLEVRSLQEHLAVAAEHERAWSEARRATAEPSSDRRPAVVEEVG
jgi:carbamoyl-phosphate synthase large subunit